MRADLLAAPVTPDLGGDTTRVIATDKAFTFLAANAPTDRQRQFFFGNRLFNTNWAEFPGLGEDLRRARPDLQPQLLLRLPCPRRPRPPAGDGGRADGIDARPPVARRCRRHDRPHPAYGDQLNDRAILGVPPEGTRDHRRRGDPRRLWRRHALRAPEAALPFRRPRLRPARRCPDQPARRARR